MEPIELKFGTVRNPVVVSLKEYKGVKLFDVRKFFPDKVNDDILIPTKKGISFNAQQLNDFFELLNGNKPVIENFFTSEKVENPEIDIKLGSFFGRKFRFDFENNITSINLDSGFSERMNDETQRVMLLFLQCVHGALCEVLEQDDEIELIQDALSHRLDKVKW